MVRILAFILFSASTQYAFSQHRTLEQDSLQGTWSLVKQRVDGKPNPDAFLRYDLIFGDDNVTFAYEDRFGTTSDETKYRFTINTKTTPMQLNLFGDRFLIQAIFKLNGDQLSIAYFGRSEIARPDDLDHAKTSRSIESPHLLWKLNRRNATADLKKQ